MDELRWSILVRQLDRRISMKEAEILMGNLNYYSALIPKGVRYGSLLNHMVARKAGLWDNKVVDLDKETLKLFKWWRLNLIDFFHGAADITDLFMKALFP